MNAFEVFDCQVDAKYAWRSEFEENQPRLRVAVFNNRLMVTGFEDASEGITGARTLFAGLNNATWRDVVSAILEDGSYATLNPDWPDGISLVAPSDLEFSAKPSTAIKLIALAWLGSEWSQAVENMLHYSDDEIAKLDETQDLLAVIERASAKTTDAFLDTDEDSTPEDFFAALINAAVLGVRN